MLYPVGRRAIAGFILCFALAGLARTESAPMQTVNLIPVPAELRTQEGHFALSPSTRILASDGLAEPVARYFAGRINPPTGFDMKTSLSDKENDGQNAILFGLNEQADPALGAEGYRLSVGRDRVLVAANRPAGLFCAGQTLLQLLPPEIERPAKACAEWSIPCVEIVDSPRFAWRGLLLDIGRHNFTKEDIRQYIDAMARYKFNTLQIHLSDDQGWRIEIKKYPALTEVGAWRVPRQGDWWSFDPPHPGEKATYGGFLTQEDVRELVAYAQARFITIVPEIDVPGHSMAALAAFPGLSCTGGPFCVNPGSKFYGQIENTLCAGNEQVYEFLDGVFGELAALFPGEYIHMGGDEAFKGFWAKCPKCMAMKKEHGLKDENELQSYFVKRVEKILESKGKRLIGWDEILEGGLAPNATVMSWRGTQGGIAAAQMGHMVVMAASPYYYLDLYQGDPIAEPMTYSMSRLNTCYGFEPLPDGIDPKLVLGVQGCLWSESVSELRHAEYMTWPRGMAVAETAWSPREKKDWPDFARRVESQFERLDAADVKYARSMFDAIFEPRLDDAGHLLIEMETEIGGLTLHYTFDGANPDGHYPKYEKPLTVPLNARELRVVACREGRIIGKQINMPIEELEKRAKR